MSLRDEWDAHLAGESCRGLPAKVALKAALGFVVAALTCRLQDLANLAWRPVDVVLASRELSNLTVMVPTLIAAMVVIHGEGLYGIVSNFDNIVMSGEPLTGWSGSAAGGAR